MPDEPFDVAVIGSGFGGSTTALRLTEKGYRVAVLEAGQRFDESTLPTTSWRLRSFVWAPKLGCYGIQRISLIKDVMVLAGAGVGGGSLNYANTLYEPLAPFYADPQWGHITDWRAELAPFYDQAKRMLGVVPNPTITPSDEVMREVAEEMGVGDTFGPTPVGVFFGQPGVEVPDPYFGGAGPARRGCLECGECMTGCRHGAKNTLLQNYLYLAEKAGAVVHPMTTVTRIRPLSDGRYAVDTERTGSWVRKRWHTFVARDVVLAAGTMGTQRLLHRHARRGPPAAPLHRGSASSPARTPRPSSAPGPSARDVDFTKRRRHHLVVPPRRADPHRAGALRQAAATRWGCSPPRLADGGGRSRPLTWLREAARHPLMLLRNLSMRHWSEQIIIALVMQTRDNSITCFTKTGSAGAPQADVEAGPRRAEPHLDPRRATTRCAASPRKIKGFAGGGWNDVFNIPMTAHFLGGAPIGDSATDRRDRRVPPRLRPPRSARRRRRRGVRQPRGEPVAHHHRAG